MENMENYEARRDKIFSWMESEGLTLILFEDNETRPDPNIRYLTGQPGNALLVLLLKGRTHEKHALLIPWDYNMAQRLANTDEIIPYADFERDAVAGLLEVTKMNKVPRGSKLEIPSVTSYPDFLKYVQAIDGYDILCRSNGAASFISELRSIKDEEEIALYREISAITNDLIDTLQQMVQSSEDISEAELALCIELEARRMGCEGTGFETLCAGSERSYGIHAFPAYTAEDFATPGLSIIDFGIKYRGYTSDVTLTFARDLSNEQKQFVFLVENAYDMAAALLKPDMEAWKVAAAVEKYFAQSKCIMPHALGHGIGLEAHEAPFLRNRKGNTAVLQPGMVLTLEPGLYHPATGGCRLENDFLITPTGAQVLTKSRVIQI
ncbi:Xaa-Pro aminopeptidase [Spirochaetia bacterium]|nr:Xaa-Pro aminopeptidase [Spirochaetia bacterium]